MNLGSFIPPIPTSKTNLYAITKEITHSIKVTKYIVGFLNFISSVFLAIVNKSIILYFEITKKANEFAMMMKAAFEKAGMSFYIESGTNQQFVILTKAQAEKLAEKFVFEFSHDVDENHVCVRFCTSWSTTEEDIKTLVDELNTMI